MTTKSKSNQNALTQLGVEKLEWLCFFATVLSCVTIICLKDMYVANVTYKPIVECPCTIDNPTKCIQEQ
jgi:hypothetical protein